MRLNNKGMTLVELLITFSLLLVIVVGMFNLIMEIKFELDDRQIAKEFTEYSATINNEIHYKLLESNPFAILIKQQHDVFDDGWICYYNSAGSCMKDASTGGFTFKHTASGLSSGKLGTDLNQMCEDIFPCSIYVYKSGNGLAYTPIALNIGGTNIISTTSEKEEAILKKHGIYYNNVFESIPNQEYVSFFPDEEEVIDKENIGMKMVGDVFVIDFSFYLIDHNKNHGFKIAYPFPSEVVS